MMAYQRDFAGAGQAGNEAPQPRPRLKRPQTDYGTSMVLYMRNRRSNGLRLESERSSASYVIDMLAPLGRRTNAAASVPSKHIHSSLNKQKHPINAISWTPEGRRLITGNSSGEFTVWNGMGFNFETLLQAHDSAIRALSWSHNDDWLISADQDGFVKYWQPNLNPVKTIEAHQGYAVRDLAFAPTDLKFVTAADDTTLRIWDFDKPDNSYAMKGHGWDVKTVDWHPTKGLIASGSKDHTVKLWDPRSQGRCLTTLNGQATVSKVAFEPQRGEGLAICSRNNVARVFDLRMMRDVIFLKGHDRDIMTLCWHPLHANLLSTGGGDGALFHYLLDELNPPEGTEASLLVPVCDSPDPDNAPAQTIHPAHRISHAHDSAIWAMDWHPLGHILATGSNDRVTRFWTRARPGETDCFHDRYHLGEAGAEAHGTWTRRNKRHQQLEDEEQEEGEEGYDGIIDQSMPVARQIQGFGTGTGTTVPGLGLPGLANGDSVGGAQALPGMSTMPGPPLALPPLPMPPAGVPGDIAMLPPPGSLDQLPLEVRNNLLSMFRRTTDGAGPQSGLHNGIPLVTPSIPPPPPANSHQGSNGQALPHFPQVPPMFSAGQNPIQFSDPRSNTGSAQPLELEAESGDVPGRRRRQPLPSQKDMWRRK